MTVASSRSLLVLASALSLLGACSDPGAAPMDDAAVPDDASTVDAYDAYATPVVCTSGTHWLYGDHGSLQMHPGGACNQCHSSTGRGPLLTIAGTLYPTAHEPTDCNGADGLNGPEMHIIVTDAMGVVTDVLADNVGNFYSQATLALPITAVVSVNGQTRAMTTPAPTGDCNTCHTQDGITGAPGRIMLP